MRLEGITKVYNTTVANRDISFNLRQGEIHALCGENGAGKSTLMKILFGMEQPSKGQIYMRDEPLYIDSPQTAINLGIGMVHQHFMLVPSFTVAENLMLGVEPVKYTRISREEVLRKTREISERYNLFVDAAARTEDITVAMMQKLEILKALYRGAKILILDEPTAVLTPQETEDLFEELILLKEQGHTIVFISHKLHEVKRISDRITVLRKGMVTGRFKTEDVDEQEISRAMIGNLQINKREQTGSAGGHVVLRASELCTVSDSGVKTLNRLSFELREGEILGIAGVEGNGQAELVQILTGRLRPEKGNVLINGNELSGRGIAAVRKMGVSYIPEDRMKDGCVTGAAVWENLLTNRLDDRRLVKNSFLKKKAIEELSSSLTAEYDIQCAGIREEVSYLSGGNIQKVVVARECSVATKLLIADQPTRGVDVGAAARIHERILQMSQQGTAVLLISADLSELLKVCTSLLVLFEGRKTAYFDSISALDERELGYYMLGLKHQDKTGE